MSQLHKKMYARLVGRVEDVLEQIEGKMRIPQSEDWMYTKEVHNKLVAALQECEDIYADADDDKDDEEYKIENILKAFAEFIEEQDRDEWLPYIDEFLEDYQKRNKD